jgi:glycerol-3-phosphate acyltransferase PlsX
LLIRKAAGSLRARLDPETTGGGYLLGLRGIVVIAHGSSSRVAITNAIALAGRGIEHDIVGRLQQTLPGRVVESSRLTNPSGTTRG